MRRTRLYCIALAILLPLVCHAQEEGGRPVFIPKGDYSVGAQLASLNFDSDNSDYMLLLNPINAKARIITFVLILKK